LDVALEIVPRGRDEDAATTFMCDRAEWEEELCGFFPFPVKTAHYDPHGEGEWTEGVDIVEVVNSTGFLVYSAVDGAA